MLHSGGDRGSHFTGVRNGWTKLIEDLGLQYEFVGARQIEEGKLNRGEYRALILPQSLAVSSREVTASDCGRMSARYSLAVIAGREFARSRADPAICSSRRR